MSTVGRLVIDLVLGTAGITAGLSGVRKQLEDFKNKSSGLAQATAQQVANDKLLKSNLQLQIAEKAEAISAANLAAVKLKAAAGSTQLMSAEAQELRTTLALTEAQRAQAAAAAGAKNPQILQKQNVFPFLKAALTAGSIGLYEFGRASVEAASQFQKDMKLVQTQAGATEDEVQRLSAGILGLAPSVQTGPDQLAKAMFHIKSVGIDEAHALDVLKVAAEGARVGNADLETTTNALVAVVMSGIDPTLNFEQAMGVLNGTVGTGNLRMQELAASLSSGILSTAKQFGLHLLDVGAAMATMADQGIPAEEAATRLRITIALIGAPTKVAAEQLKRIGLTSRDIADQMRGSGGLIGALTLLKTKLEASNLDVVEQTELLKTAFGGSRSSAGILTLINSLDLMAKKEAAIKKSSEGFGAAFAAESETADAKFATFNATLEVMRIEIGNALLPVVTDLAEVLGTLAQNMAVVLIVLGPLTAAITALAVKAMAEMIVEGLGLIKMWILNAASFVAMRTIFASTGAGLVVDMGQVGEGAAQMAAMTTSAAEAAATLSAEQAGLITTLQAQTATMHEAAAAAGELVVGTETAAGAMEATAASTGPVIAGFAGIDGAIEATVASTGPLVAGFAGIDGAIEATTASTGQLVIGLAGIDGAIEATAASTGPLVIGLATADGAIEATTLSTGGLILTTGGLVPAATAAAGALALETTAAVPAAASMWGLAAATTVAALPLELIVGVIALVIAILVILVTQTDKVREQFEIAFYKMGQSIVQFLDIVSSIPGVGDKFKDAAAAAHRGLDAISQDITHLDEKIATADPGNSFVGQVQSIIDQAKAAAMDGGASIGDDLVASFGTSLGAVEAVASFAGADEMKKYADGIKSERQAPVDAYKSVLDALKTPMSEQAEIAQLYGEMTSKEMADGLASSDPDILAATLAWQKSIQKRLDDITHGAYTAGTDAAASWEDAFMQEQVNAGISAETARHNINVIETHNPGEIIAYGNAYAELGDVWKNKLAPSAQTAAAAMAKLRQQISEGASVSDQVSTLFNEFGYDLAKLGPLGEAGGKDLMFGIAHGMKANEEAINTALTDLHTMLTTSATNEARTAYLMAVLQSEELAKGLTDSRTDVREQAQATEATILEEMQRLVPGSFIIGAAAANALGLGYHETLATINPITGFTVPVTVPQDAMSKATSDYAAWLKGLEDKSNQAFGSISSQASSDLTTAFNEIKSKAMEFFDAVHSKTMKAIQDAHDHKNALLDAKEALIQGPVDAAQKALDKQRAAIEEWRLRQAVAQAKTPEEQRDAILALQDFLAQQHIDDMQSEADAQKAQLEAQKKANDDQLQAQIDAENKRYEQQKKDFERQLAALERFLKSHPQEWAKTQSKIMALLASYGISYQSAGSALGADFVQGLRDQVKAAQDAAAALVKAGTPGAGAAGGYGAGTPPSGIGGTGSTGVIIGGAIGAGGLPSGYSPVPTQTAPAPAPAPTTAPHPINPSGPGKAGGGPIYKGVPTWVGEAGKELYVPSMDGYILDHAASLRAMEALTTSAVGLGRSSDLAGPTETPDIARPVVRVDPGGFDGSRGDGKTTIIFQVGEEKFGEISDLALYQHQQRQRRTSVTRVGSSRR